MKISHDIFKKINIQIDLKSNTYNQVCDIFKKHNIKCNVENMRLLLNGIVDMDLGDICIEVDSNLKLYENINFEYQFDMDIVEKLILNQSIDFELDELDMEIVDPTLKLEIPITMDLDELCIECYGQLIISMSVGSTKSVTIGDCKNLTLFQYYSDTLDTKVSTTREITIGEVKDNTLFEYYNNTNIS